MKSRNRLALVLGLAMAANGCLTAPSSAQKSDAAARSAQISELSRAGKYSEAVPLAQRLLADMEQAHGPDHRDVAASLNNLALLYGSLGRDADAEPLLKRSIALVEKLHGLGSSEAAHQLNNLAALYQRQQRYAEAEPLFKRALAIPRKDARARASRRGAVAEQSGHPLREAGPACRLRAVVQASAGDLRESSGSGASRGRDRAEQSRTGRQGPGAEMPRRSR